MWRAGKGRHVPGAGRHEALRLGSADQLSSPTLIFKMAAFLL